jgi:hypothetical protein
VSGKRKIAEQAAAEAILSQLLDQIGPSHLPTFTAVAWGTLPDSRTARTAPISASSKKAGQPAAAHHLLDLPVREGVTRR